MRIITVRTTHPVTGAEVEVGVPDHKDGQGSPFQWVVWGGWGVADVWRTDGVRSPDRAKARQFAEKEAKAADWSVWHITQVRGDG